MEVYLSKTYAEAELVELLSEGSNIGFAYLYDNYSSALLGIITSILTDENLAQDILQETFVNIYRKFGTYEPSKSRLFTWMATIARNLSIDFVQSKRYRNETKNVNVDFAIELPHYSQGLNTDHLGLRGYIMKLDKKYSKLLEMNYLQGYTNEEIAKMLDIPVGTVKTRIRTALIQMRHLMMD